MTIVSNVKLQELFSLALEQRSPGYQDLVSNANAILYTMKAKGGWRSFSGPTIRERLLYNETGKYTRYSGFDNITPAETELVNDAEFTPKLAAVPITLSGEQILQNAGNAQLADVMLIHLKAAEQELEDGFVADLHSDGTASSGKQIGGLQLAIPTNPNVGTYGGINRATATNWRTTAFNANSDFSGITGVAADTVLTIFDSIMIQRSRGNRGPGVVACSQQHYTAYSSALQAIQRINDTTTLGEAGFQSLAYHSAGKRCDVTLEGGIGTNMPDDVSYFLDFGSGGGSGANNSTPAICFRYHPDRNFSTLGETRVPDTQDAIIQHVGFFGELTMNNPLHLAKLYDSAP